MSTPFARLPRAAVRRRFFASPGWLREPLLHFVVIGAVLFGADHLLFARAGDPRLIVVGAEADAEARQVFQASRGRPPNADELRALRKVWLDNEVLYREGLALQVDKGDTAIRERVIFKALSVIDASVQRPPVDDRVLRDWFQAHRAKYDEPARFDFDEAVLSGDTGEAAVRAFVQALNGGTPGDAKAGLRVFKGRPLANLVQSYGDDFASAVQTLPPGEWTALPSRDGWRAVRLNAVAKPQPARFEPLRGVVLQDWTDAVLSEQRSAAVSALAKKYRIVDAAPRAMIRRALRGVLLVLLVLLVLPWGARAHEMSMAEMQLRETSRGEFLWMWTAANEKLPTATDGLVPAWPDGCRAEGNALHCGEAGLQGTLSIDGVGKRYSAALVKVFWLDGRSVVYTLTAGQPTVHLYGAADDRRGLVEVARAYVVLGVEHILTGFDHLLFVIGLLFLVGFNRRLVATITAFTVAHSLTLASSALGWLTLRSPPVEATIALSILLVAAEALQPRQTLSRRWPALVAFIFGLVHGLGFAGALAEIGLPQNHLFVALLTFNLGVEAGQLAVVGAAFFGWRWLRRWDAAAQTARTPALYAIGSVAAYWTIGRVAGIFG